MKTDYDLIIVGARIAGSIIGTLVGGKGHRVLILDRAHFPSDTISTHFFRWPAFNVFERIGVLGQVYTHAPKLVNNYNDVDGHVFIEPVEGPDGPSHYICIRRTTLDEILVRRARQEKTVLVREGAMVEGLIVEDDRVAGVRWSDGGAAQSATARVVVGADGINSIVAKKVRPATEKSEPVLRAMYYGYYRNFEAQPGPAAEFHYRGNHLVYAFPTDGGLSLLAASVPIDEFGEFKKNPEARFTAELESMPEVAKRLGRAEREGPVKGSGSIPGYQRLPYGKGWVLAGDSSQIMDPWSGQGIDQASTHAAFASEALIAWLSGESGWDEAMEEYNRKRHEFSDVTFDRTCRAARDLRPMTRAALKKRGLA